MGYNYTFFFNDCNATFRLPNFKIGRRTNVLKLLIWTKIMVIISQSDLIDFIFLYELCMNFTKLEIRSELECN
jgi:hypothetical protein